MEINIVAIIVSFCAKDELSALFSFVYIRVKIDIWNVAVQNRARSFDHSIGELRVHANGMSMRSRYFNENCSHKKVHYSRYSSYSLDLARFNEIQCLDLLYYGTQELSFASALRWGASFLYLG